MLLHASSDSSSEVQYYVKTEIPANADIPNVMHTYILSGIPNNSHTNFHQIARAL